MDAFLWIGSQTNQILHIFQSCWYTRLKNTKPTHDKVRHKNEEIRDKRDLFDFVEPGRQTPLEHQKQVEDVQLHDERKVGHVERKHAPGQIK